MLQPSLPSSKRSDGPPRSGLLRPPCIWSVILSEAKNPREAGCLAGAWGEVRLLSAGGVRCARCVRGNILCICEYIAVRERWMTPSVSQEDGVAIGQIKGSPYTKSLTLCKTQNNRNKARSEGIGGIRCRRVVVKRHMEWEERKVIWVKHQSGTEAEACEEPSCWS